MRIQREFELNGGNWGGLRQNAGRKRQKSKGVSHRVREEVNWRYPLHINIKVRHPIRNQTGLLALSRSIHNARKFMHVLHYSLESNHIHLIVEAENNLSLDRGMKSFSQSFSRSLNKGSIQDERYHLHVLKTPAEVKNTFRYVLLNHVHHTKTLSIRSDGYNSLYMFDLKEISKKWNISITKEKFKDPIELDYPSSWLAHQY